MRTTPTSPEARLLAEIGVALYGRGWKTLVAADLGVHSASGGNVPNLQKARARTKTK